MAFIPTDAFSKSLLSTYCVSGIMPSVENTAEKKINERFNLGSSILVGRRKYETNNRYIMSSDGETCDDPQNKERALRVTGGSKDGPLWGSDIWTEV